MENKNKLIGKNLILLLFISLLSFSVLGEIDDKYYSSFDEDLKNSQQLCIDFNNYYSDINDFTIEIYNYSNNDLVQIATRNNFVDWLPNPYNIALLDTRDGFCNYDPNSIGFRLIEYDLNTTNFDFLINLTISDTQNNTFNNEFRIVLTNESYQYKPLDDLRILNTQDVEYQQIFYNLEDYYINVDAYNIEFYFLNWTFITSGTQEEVINLFSGLIDTRKSLQPNNNLGFRYIEHNELEEFEIIVSIDAIGQEGFLPPDTFIFELYQDIPIELIDINLTNYYYDKPDNDYINQIKITENNKYLLVGTNNNNIFIYENNHSGFELVKSINVPYTLQSIFFNILETKFYVTTLSDIRIYEIGNNFDLLAIEYANNLNKLSFLYDNYVYTFETSNEYFRVRDKENLQIINTINIGENIRKETNIKIKDDYLYYINFNNNIKRLNLLTNQTELFLQNPVGNQIRDVIIGLEITNNYLIFSTHNDIVYIYNMSDLSLVTSLNQYEITTTTIPVFNNMLSVSKAGDVLSFIANRGVVLYDLNELSVIEFYNNIYDAQSKTHITFNYDDSLLAFGSRNGHIYIYETNYIKPFIQKYNIFNVYDDLNIYNFDDEIIINTSILRIDNRVLEKYLYYEVIKNNETIDLIEICFICVENFIFNNEIININNYNLSSNDNLSIKTYMYDANNNLISNELEQVFNINTQKPKINRFEFDKDFYNPLDEVYIIYDITSYEPNEETFIILDVFKKINNLTVLEKTFLINNVTTNVPNLFKIYDSNETKPNNIEIRIEVFNDNQITVETISSEEKKGLFFFPSPEQANKNDVFVLVFGTSIFLIFCLVGYKFKLYSIFYIGLLGIFFIGLMLLFNGWNLILSILLSITPIILLFSIE